MEAGTIVGNPRQQAEETFRKVMKQFIARWELKDIKPSVSRKRNQLFLHHDLADLKEIIDDDGNIGFALRVTRLLPTADRGSQVRTRGWFGELNIVNRFGRMMLVDSTISGPLVDVEDEDALNAVFDRMRPNLT